METVAAPRSWAGFVRDWLPLALILISYLILHELAETLAPGAHVLPQLGFDEQLVGGNAPTVQLQRALWDSGHVHWYDYLTWLVYLSHFVVTLSVAAVLWARSYQLFRRLRALVLTVTFAGFATYILYPAIPPWLASARGDMPPTVRVVREVWRHLGMADVAAVFGEKSQYAFPVGALPSLHAAWPFLLMLLFWSRAGRWRILLVGYVLAMSFTLVYTADHYAFDILLGWTYSTVTFVAIDHASMSRPWRKSSYAERSSSP